MNNEVWVGILSVLVAAVVAFFVAQHRISQDRRTRQREWLRDRISHLNSASRALKRFEARLTSKRSDVMAYLDQTITLDQIGGLQLRYPEALFASDTDKCIFEDEAETEVVDKVNELEELIDELEDLVAQFVKEGDNPDAGSLSDHLKSMVDTSIEVNTLVEGVRDRLKVKLTKLH